MSERTDLSRYENSSEFFGFGAWLRSQVYPVSRRFTWLKYVIAATGLGAVVAQKVLLHGWVQFGCFAAVWMAMGLIWFFVFSKERDIWWTRRRRKTVLGDLAWSLGLVLLIVVYTMGWWLWMVLDRTDFDDV